MSQIVIIKVYKNGELSEIKQFDASQIVIGSSGDAHLQIQDDSISVLHAVINRKDDNNYYISDLGSQTGVHIGGKKVLESQLESECEIQLGGVQLSFSVGVPGGAAIAPTSEQQSEDVEEVVSVSSTNDVTIQEVQDRSQDSQTFVEEDGVEEESVEVKTIEAEVLEEKKEEPKLVAAKITKKAIQKSESPAPRPEGTFAPPSAIEDLRTVIKPEKGTVVEVVVAWKERILQTHHYNEARSVTIGSDPGSDINVPLLGTSLSKHKFLQIDSLAHIFLTPEMSGEYIEGGKSSKNFTELLRTEKMHQKGTQFVVDLAQGDMLVIALLGGTLKVYVRYTSETPKPLMAPLLDLTASEITGIILAVVVASIFGLYMMVYAPEQLEEELAKTEEPFRRAIVQFKPPKPKEVVKVAEETQKKIVKVEAVKKEEKKAPPSAKSPGQTGKAATLKPTQSPKKSKTLTATVEKGGAVKTGRVQGANAKSKNKPDVNNMGLLGAFASKGMKEKLNKAYDGSGGLVGLADQATGAAGFNEDRKGPGLGGRLKATGAGGQGKSSVGISGPLTSGRGSGVFGSGPGGIGKKGSVEINIASQEAEFVGTIDREAIRRVILANIAQIRQCYERALNKSPDLFGKLVIEWDIVERGKVKNARVKSNTLGNNSVGTCVRDRLSSWRFPEPPEDQVARVTYPFVFASK